MKRHVLAALAVLSLATAGCSAIPALSAPNTASVQAITLGMKKALAELHVGYNAVGGAYLDLKARGLVAVEVQAQAKAIDAKLYAVLKAADTANRIGDATNLQAQINQGQALLAQFRALVPAK